MYKFNINIVNKIFTDLNNTNSKYMKYVKTELLVDKSGILVQSTIDKNNYYIFIPNILAPFKDAEHWANIDYSQIDLNNIALDYEFCNESNSKMLVSEVDKILDDHASYIFNCYRDNKEGYKLLNEDNLIYLDLSDVMQRLYFTNLGIAMNMIKPLVKDIMNRIEGAVIA